MKPESPRALVLSVEQPVDSHLPCEYIECRNCNLDVLKHSYRTHLDEKATPGSSILHLPFECEHDGCDKAVHLPGRLANHVKTHDFG
jgi:hypothetical protein